MWENSRRPVTYKYLKEISRRNYSESGKLVEVWDTSDHWQFLATIT